MSSKQNILVILEKQVDKIVLGVIILISLVLLWMYVVGNPYGAKVRIGGREITVNPGNIDRKLKADAEKLLAGLEQPPKASEYDIYDQSHVDRYVAKLQCAVPGLNADLAVPYPGVGEAAIQEDRLYAMPSVPALGDVQVARVRGAARVPVEEVSPGMPYTTVETKIEDIDFVSVSGHLDLQRLYNNFQLSFAGPGLKSSWRSDEYAKPILARIELQRRVQLNDGTYGDWQTVPRAKIDLYKKLIEQLPLKADQMQFGVDVWISQYQSPDVQLNILQPQPYEFVRSRLDWKPPQFLQEVEQIKQREKDQQRRELIEERRRTLEDNQRTTAGRGGADRRGGRQPAGGRAADRGREEMAQPEDPRERMAARRTERTERDVERDMQAAMLKTAARLDNVREPVMVWAHDDTVQPGQTYEYRIRIGVFNPITGKDWFMQEQLAFRDQTVLWSDFTEPGKPVEVPKMLHVFPMDPLSATRADGSKEIEGVKVEVAKYYMGQWQTHQFDVYPGQPIGSAVEQKPEDGMMQADGMMDTRMAMTTLDSTQTTTVDYASGMTMVDVLTEIDWGTRMRRSDFYNMLYHSSAGLQQVGIGRSNWPAPVRSAYDSVQNAMKEEIQTLGPSYDRMRGDPMRRGDELRERPGGL